MSSGINFFCENISYTLRRKGVLRKWLFDSIAREGKIAGDLNFILCDDDFLSELNFKYLKHKTLTDILTFSSDDGTGVVCGDIFISLPRVTENARIYNQHVEDELHRVMIHGILHLAGHNDISKTEKSEMHRKEDFHLNFLPKQ